MKGDPGGLGHSHHAGSVVAPGPHCVLTGEKKHIDRVLSNPGIVGDDGGGSGVGGVGHLFLVGGFAESPIVQDAVRDKFGTRVNVIIPQGVALAVLRGAVLYGLDPSVVHVRKATKTYGIGIIRPFDPEKHPDDKLVIRDGKMWCLDVFDKFVSSGQSVSLGEAVARKYRPVTASHRQIVLGVFASDSADPAFVTDSGVEQCGCLTLDLGGGGPEPDLGGGGGGGRPREIQAKMLFGDTEIKATAMDVATGRSVRCNVDFLNESNPKYHTKL